MEFELHDLSTTPTKPKDRPGSRLHRSATTTGKHSSIGMGSPIANPVDGGRRPVAVPACRRGSPFAAAGRG